jgi:hypothetical protein
MNECISVTEARYVGDYRIWLQFNTGESNEVDLRNLVFKFSAAAPLRERSEFARFYLDEWPTLAWTCGFDVDPEYLYTLATGNPTYETAIAQQTHGATA